MLLTAKIKVRTSWLGAERTRHQVRRFERDSQSSKLKLDLAQWNWALGQAVDALQMDTIDVSSVRFPTTMVSPSFEMLVRRWSQIGKGQLEEKFESIRAGTHLTFDVLITSAREPAANTGGRNDGRPPTLGEFEEIMRFIGEQIGLSPWGNRMGYGRFDLLELHEHTAKRTIHSTETSSAPGVGRVSPDSRTSTSVAFEEAYARREEARLRQDNKVDATDENSPATDLHGAAGHPDGDPNLPGFVEEY